MNTFLVPTVWTFSDRAYTHTFPSVAYPTATPGLAVTVWDPPDYCGEPDCPEPHNLPLGNYQPKRRWDLKPWQIVHTRSGLAVGRFATRGKARRFAKALGGFDWTRHTHEWTETDQAALRELIANTEPNTWGSS